ncbi:MAG: glycosyltransferase [Bryobacteraceae bacterium]|nr:glycosyltransferase [Bryobacteraceae bacterium]
MRILLVTNSFSRVHVVYLARALAPDHPVHVVSFGKDHDPRSLGKLQWFSQATLVEREDRPGLLRGWKSLEPHSVVVNRSAEMERALRLLASRDEYDLIVFEQLAMAQYGGCGFPRERTRLFAVDCLTRALLQVALRGGSPGAFLGGGLGCLLMRRYESSMAARFPATIYVSKVDAEYAVKRRLVPAERVKILPLAVDTDYFIPSAEAQRQANLLVFFANLGEYKSEHGLLWFHRNVWPLLKRRLPDLRLEVVGVNPRPRVQALAMRDPDVTVVGFAADLRPRIRAAGCVIVPLRIGVGMKNRVLESLALGQAVVSSSAGVEGLGVRNGRELLVADQPRDFAEQVESVLTNPALASELGLAGRAYVEREHTLAMLRGRFLAGIAGVHVVPEPPLRAVPANA